MAGHVCAVKDCFNNRAKTNDSFFSFPKDSQRAILWLHAIGRDDLEGNTDTLYKSHRICGAHFEDKCFLNDLHNRLQPTAIPTLLPQLQSYVFTEHNYAVFVATEQAIVEGENTQLQVRENKENVNPG